MDFEWSDEHRALRKEARLFAVDAVARLGRFNDSWINGFDRELSRELARRGWIGMSWPDEQGRARHDPLARLIVAEELITAGAPIGASWFADRQIGPALIGFGTDEQKRRYLPAIRAGEVTWCLGMSEPDTGSDLASVRTAAVRDGDTYVINGRKIWTSFAAQADYCYLIARTSWEGRPHEGISELIVPMDAPGVSVTPIRDLVGGEHFCEVTFDDVRVPAENLVGREGRAFSQTMRQLEHERGGIDRLVSNRALLDIACRRASELSPLQRVERAKLEEGYAIGRLLVIREALGQAPPGFSAATKCFGTEHEQAVAAFATRLLGAEGMLWTQVVRGLCYAPAYTIMGGTSNILRNILAERVLGLPREPR
ncbi:MAG TPA: acyl-CoA dehydrogenase family protein [Acidimicrobiales bacterium]